MPSIEPKHARAVERLAFRMYEASETSGIPWLRRGWTVRVAWLKAAQERLQDTGMYTGGSALWRNAWVRAKLAYFPRA